jgi:hypothetical protein
MTTWAALSLDMSYGRCIFTALNEAHPAFKGTSFALTAFLLFLPV